MKGNRAARYRDINRQSNSLWSICLGAWYFNRSTSWYFDRTNTNHYLTRRSIGTKQDDFVGKFPAICPYNDNSLPDDKTPIAATTYTGFCDAINTYRSFSIALWFKGDSANEDTNQMLLMIGGEATNSSNYGFLYKSGTAGLIQFRTGGAVTGPQSTGNLIDDEWHLIVGTYGHTRASNNRKLYVDGLLDAQDSTTSTVVTTGGLKLFQGSMSYSFQGNLFFAGIWGRELDYQEVKKMYNDPWVFFNYPLVVRAQSGGAARIADLMPFMPM